MIAVDTGFLLALADKDDQWHTRAMAYIQRREDDPWVSTWPVLTETCHLLGARVGVDFAYTLLADVAHGSLQLWSPTAEQLNELPRLMRKYAALPMDLADASLVLLAEHLGHGRILTTDVRDFGAYRWKSRKPFHNVLEETTP